MRDTKNNNTIIEGKLSKPEFSIIKEWHLFEKIHGVNTRIIADMNPQGRIINITYAGRTDSAQMSKELSAYLKKTFTPGKFQATFKPKFTKSEEPHTYRIVLYGEGYGAKIQKGGGKYRKDCAFILFDVWIDNWWLNQENVKDIAEKLGIKSAPFIGIFSMSKAVQYVKSNPKSTVAQEDMVMEGIVAKTNPPLLFRSGDPVMWKLKVCDFRDKSDPANR